MKLSPVLENLFETQSWSRLIASNLLFWKKLLVSLWMAIVVLNLGLCGLTPE